MTGNGDDRPQFPLYVRVLAVIYVLSHVLGPAGFFLLAGFGCFLYARRGAVDNQVIELWVAGAACPGAGALFRRWFRSWGRMNWPDGKPDSH